jgi:hypothetical protein
MDVAEVRTAVYVRGGNHALEQRLGLCYYAMLWHMHIYGWTGRQPSSGFSDRPRPTLGGFASSDRL